NPAVGSAHGRAQRLGMANLDWLVVRDLFLIESATFWKDGPEVATGEIVPTDCRTEVFVLPAASHVEKEGTFTQTQRLLQWREKAVDPPGDCRSELWFFHRLGTLIRERLAASTLPRDRAGRPWSERKAYVWWDPEQQRWAGHDVPDFIATMPPDHRPDPDAAGVEGLAGDDAFVMQGDGKGWLYVPTGLTDGPLPTHYEPV